jgi:hypothetical protein
MCIHTHQLINLHPRNRIDRLATAAMHLVGVMLVQ